MFENSEILCRCEDKCCKATVMIYVVGWPYAKRPGLQTANAEERQTGS